MRQHEQQSFEEVVWIGFSIFTDPKEPLEHLQDRKGSLWCALVQVTNVARKHERDEPCSIVENAEPQVWRFLVYQNSDPPYGMYAYIDPLNHPS